MEPGSVVRAVFEFLPSVSEELPLFTGDVIEVLNVVDEFWLLGNKDGVTGGGQGLRLAVTNSLTRLKNHVTDLSFSPLTYFVFSSSSFSSQFFAPSPSPGQFPSTFVEAVTIPSTKPEDKLYVCINDFSTAMPGSLPLQRGMCKHTHTSLLVHK